VRVIAAGYPDTFRLFIAEPGHYTWRIDYVFVSDELRARGRAATILPHVLGSDHCPITLTLE
jgi:exodeoxyribonuclease-3